VLDILKENGRRLRQEVSLTQWDERASAEGTDETASCFTRLPRQLTTPDRSIELTEARRPLAQIETVMSEFSEQWQRIFEQCLLLQRPEKEVAEEMQLAHGTVRNYIRQIRRELRKRCRRQA